MLASPGFDFEYGPALGEASEFLRASNATRFLLLGEPLKSRPGLPDGFEDVHECRHVQASEAQLPTGIYRFRLEDGCAVMLVTVGVAPGRPERGDRAADGSSSLGYGAEVIASSEVEAARAAKDNFECQ